MWKVTKEKPECFTLIYFFAGESYIFKALWLLRNELFSMARHHGNREGAINMALIITDSQYPVAYPGPRDAVQTVAKQARDHEIGTHVLRE